MLSRIFRRKAGDVEPGLEPVESLLDDHEGVPETSEYEESTAAVHPPMRTEVRWRLAAGLVAAILIGLLLSGELESYFAPDLLARWPWLLVIFGAISLLIGLVTAWPYATLGGPLVAVIGLVVLLGRQGTTTNIMVGAGVVLIAMGLGVLIRGLTMPRA